MQDVFKRYEKKYLLSPVQAAALESAFSRHMATSVFDNYWVQNLYFDTPCWSVIDHSMQRPYYKEKLRLRYYGTPDMQSPVFLELKKKYAGVVYKRRLALPFGSMEQDLALALQENGSQIARELLFHLQSTPLSEQMFLSYRRRAWDGVEDSGLRVTLDSEIRYRLDGLHFQNPQGGKAILDPGVCLMEVKSPVNIPLWLSQLCSEHGIFSAPFSKYAACYTDYFQEKNTKRKVTADV